MRAESRRLRPNRPDRAQRGQAFVFVLAVLLLVSAFAGIVMNSMRRGIDASNTNARRTTLRHACETGLTHARADMAQERFRRRITGEHRHLAWTADVRQDSAANPPTRNVSVVAAAPGGDRCELRVRLEASGALPDIRSWRIRMLPRSPEHAR